MTATAASAPDRGSDQPPSLRWLRLLAISEAASVIVLLANRATVHLDAVTSLIGPLHGTLYLATIATAVLSPIRRRAKWLAMVPILGGLLALMSGPITAHPSSRQPGGRLATKLGQAAPTGRVEHPPGAPVTSDDAVLLVAGARSARLPSMRIERVVPNLASRSVAESQNFYEKILGVVPVMDLGWIVTLADPDRRAAQISIMTYDQTAPVIPSVSVQVDDVDKAYAAALREHAEIVHPLTDEPWGVRRFFVRDPDGHVINVLSHG